MLIRCDKKAADRLIELSRGGNFLNKQETKTEKKFSSLQIFPDISSSINRRKANGLKILTWMYQFLIKKKAYLNFLSFYMELQCIQRLIR